MVSMSKIILALDFSCKNELDCLLNKVTPDLCKLKVGKELYKKSQSGVKIVYWNLMVRRHLSGLPNMNIQRIQPLQEEINAQDKGFFYLQKRITVANSSS